MESWIIEHLWKILTAIGTAITGIITYLIIEAKWKTRTETRIESLEQTRDSMRECLPDIKTDIAELKKESAVQKETLDWMKKSQERIEAKLDKRDVE